MLYSLLLERNSHNIISIFNMTRLEMMINSNCPEKKSCLKYVFVNIKDCTKIKGFVL